jgi:hypothetical protein
MMNIISFPASISGISNSNLGPKADYHETFVAFLRLSMKILGHYLKSAHSIFLPFLVVCD